jgi:P4 family phage/plasmid primase-like protien
VFKSEADVLVNLNDIIDKDLENPSSPELIEAATTEIMNKYRFVTIQETDQIWYYKEGVYVPGGEIIIAKEAENTFHFEINSSKVTEIKGHIMRLTYRPRCEFDSDNNIINLKNGLYDLKNNLLKEHSPDYLSINQKSIIYDKNAKPKLFGKFLSEVLSARDIRTATDVMAYTFHRDYDIEAFFILYGVGANGKTVFTSLLSHLHGKNNVSNVPLPMILKNRFALSDLENKDVNIDNELPGYIISEAAVLKRLTGGSRQSVRIERKNQKAYDTTLYAKLFFNTNKMPESEDMSDAYNRRVIIISFPNQFDGAREDKQLIAKLTTQQEISGIFNLLMVYLRRILKNGELYVNEKTIEEKRARYERAVNPIKAFLEEALVEEELTEADEENKEHIYKAYVMYCDKYSLPVEKFEMLSRVLKSKFGYKDRRQEVKGKKIAYWKCMRLSEEYVIAKGQTPLALLPTSTTG